MNNRLRCFCQLGDLQAQAGFLTATRRHIHQHPELSFQEAGTAALVAQHLEEWGWQVTRNVGGHGVVGTLKAGTGSKAIALRADMDALPITEAAAKVREGWPGHVDEEDDLTSTWVGVVPIRETPGEPLAHPDIPADVPLSPAVAAWVAARR